MKRVIILGRGASGKSALAVRLAEITELPVIELDKLFWQKGLRPTPRGEWANLQRTLIPSDGWIIEGDLGLYDVVEVRLRAADTIIFLDFSLIRCAWRAMRRSRERADFWRWLVYYRRDFRPVLMDAIARHAPEADLHVLRNPGAVSRFVAGLALKSGPN
jgi:adenylate kinase family enzyme